MSVDDDDDKADAARCKLCKKNSRGDVFQFWTGCREKYTEKQFGANLHVHAQYSDMKQVNVFACDRCVRGLRGRHYLPHVIGWGVVAGPALITLAVAPLLGMDGMSLTVCSVSVGLIALPTTLMWVIRLWQAFRPPPAAGTSETTDRLVLQAYRAVKKGRRAGYDYFTLGEYEGLFERHASDG